MRYQPQAAVLGLTLFAALAFAALPARAADADAPSVLDEADDAVTAMPAPSPAPTVAASPGPQATPEASPVPAASAPEKPIVAVPLKGSLKEQLAQLDNQLDDQEADIRAMNAALNGVRSVAELKDGESLPDRSEDEEESGDMLFDVAGPDTNVAEEQPLVWRRLSLLVNVDLEYTNEYDTDPDNKKGVDLGKGNSPDYIQVSGTPNGDAGMFFKHIDVHFKYKFTDSMFMKLDYNLSALELDDVGVGWQRIPIWGDYNFSVFVGQKRQFFGIEQQTDSRNLMFPNRAMMYGGHSPFAKVVEPSADPFALFDQSTTLSTGLTVNNEDDAGDDMVTELAFERVMGVHLFHTHDLGFLAYNLGVDIVNDESEDSQDGQVTDTLNLAFPLQTQDQDISEIGRLGIQPRILNDQLPFGGKFNFGFSAFHDPENTHYYAGQASQEEWSDTQGLDGTFQTDRDVLYLQSEYVKRDQYGPSFNTTTFLPNNVYGGLQGRAESYYVAGSFQPWRLFDPEAPRVELMARFENYYYDDVSNWLRLALGPYTGSFNAVTVALKYTYMGNCHTGIYYTSYGLNNNYGALGPTSYLQLEQQVTF